MKVEECNAIYIFQNVVFEMFNVTKEQNTLRNFLIV